MVRIGCCGFPLARAKYFKKFDLVEIQQTFHHIPQVKTLARWRQEAPKSFEFALKAWQLITHPPSSPSYEKLKEPLRTSKTKNYGSFQLTSEVLLAWEKTQEAARALNARFIVFESAREFVPEKTNIDNLTKFFGSIERGDYRMVWETHQPWPEDLVISLCRDLDLIYSFDPFTQTPLGGHPRYVKLRGRPGTGGGYPDEDLQELRRRAADLPESYILFSNEDMLTDAERFKKLMK